MPDLVLDTVDAVDRLQRAELRSGARLLVGIAGPPGSGKSTLAAEIAHVLGARAAVVPMDGFHLTNAELDERGLRDRKGAPETFDVDGFAALLTRLRNAEAVTAPAFDRTIDASRPDAITIDTGVTIVIVEGNYLLFDGAWERVRRQLDEAWFIDIDDRLRRERLVCRHMEFGRTREQAVAWTHEVDEANARAIIETRARASAVLRPTTGALPRPSLPVLAGEESRA